MPIPIPIPLIRFAIALGVQTAAAITFHPALWLPGRRRLALLAGVWLPILLAPLIVPQGARFLRLLSSITAVTFALKLYDLYVGARRGVRPTVGQLAVFLFNAFSLVHRNLIHQPPPDNRHELRTMVRASPGLVAGLIVAVLVFRADWSRLGFWPEHAAKAVAFFLVLVPLVAAFGAAWRLAGLPGREHMNNPFAARTPADFWRRYNRPVHEFLRNDVFHRASARRAVRHASLRATLATFVLSAAVHEYVFTLPVGRVQGYQTAFFLVQGLAVWATLRVKPRGWRIVPWVAATFVFNIVTGALFFASLNHVVPFYQHHPPLWAE